MVDAAPFRALHYDSAIAGDPATTSAPAYSELERFAYAGHRTASPYTVLELIAPGPDGHYGAAAAAYDRWRRTGVLVEDSRPAFFRYEQHELRRGVPAVQRGVLAAVALEPPGASVLLHEEVDPARVATRLERLRVVPVEISPVFGLYSGGSAELRGLLACPPRTAPVAAFTDEAGVDHRVWRIDEPDEIACVREGLRGARVVIADGHHRYASALAYRDELRVTATRRTLMYLVDPADHGPEVRPVHRLVRSWQPGAPSRLARDFTIEQLDDALGAAADGDVALGLRLPGRVELLLRPRKLDALLDRLPDGHSETWRHLDAAVLDYALLPWLGAAGVEARSDASAAAAEVDAGAAAALFLLRPTDARTVFALAVSGERMPAKTTWFRPKPRAGLIMRALLPHGAHAPTVER